MDRNSVIANAKKAALRDGYDQLVIGSVDGSFSFCRAADRKATVPILDGELLFGCVSHTWNKGIAEVQYHDYSQTALWRFIATLEPNRKYEAKELHELHKTWSEQNHFQPLALNTLYDALTAPNSVVHGLMTQSQNKRAHSFTLSPEIKDLMTGRTQSKEREEDQQKQDPFTRPFRIAITETYVREVEIYAANALEAEQMAEDLCNDGTIDLDAEDFVERSTECRGIARPIDLELHGSFGHKSNRYIIYQLKNIPDLRYHRFSDLESLARDGNRVAAANYDMVYYGPLTQHADPCVMLEYLYHKFNVDRPADFKGHALSVSDIIVIEKEGNANAYYVDSFDFKEVPEFFGRAPEQSRPSLEARIQEVNTRKTFGTTFRDAPEQER